MPVRNEALFIGKTLQGFLNQDYPRHRYEILIVDGDSSDETVPIVQALQVGNDNLKLFSSPKRLASAARNIGVRHARGDYVAVVDGHCEIDNPCYLANIADAFARSGADCLGRPQPLDVSGATPLQKAIAAARSSWLGHHPASFIYSDQEQFVEPQSVAVAYRRAVFDKLGGFDEAFDACEDVEFNQRVHAAGLRCFFTPRIAVPYVPRGTLRGLFRQMARYGRGRMRLLRKHPSSFSIASLVPAFFLLGIIVGPLLSWFVPLCGVILAACLTLYAIIVCGVSLSITWRAQEIRLLPWLLLVFPTVHLGTGYGVLVELFTGFFRGAKPKCEGVA